MAVSAVTQRRYRSSKRMAEVREQFDALPPLYKGACVLRAMGRAARIDDKVIDREVRAFEQAEQAVEARIRAQKGRD